jgi:hypothetical protein
MNIIAAYDLNPAREDIDWMSDVQLPQFIVTATDVQMTEGENSSRSAAVSRCIRVPPPPRR